MKTVYLQNQNPKVELMNFLKGLVHKKIELNSIINFFIMNHFFNYFSN